MIVIRSAESADQAAIRTLVRRARINRSGLHWQNFVVAEADGQLIGTAQLKPHRGVVELASVAVDPAWQGQGVARRLIEHLLAEGPPTVWLMCAARLAPLYAKFGFVPVTDTDAMPRYFRRMQRLVNVVLFITRFDSHLAVMRRATTVDDRAPRPNADRA